MTRFSDLLLGVDEVTTMRVFGSTDAAVLVPLFQDPAEGWVAVLTERRHDLRKHPGEIAFPGGRRDEGEELVATALREAEEEIGLPRDRVDVVGALAPATTLVTSYRIYPFVGVLEAGAVWAPQDTEVAQVLELPLRALVAGRRRRPLPAKGVPVPTIHFVVDGHVVWGATARLTDQLLRRLAPLL